MPQDDASRHVVDDAGYQDGERPLPAAYRDRFPSYRPDDPFVSDDAVVDWLMSFADFERGSGPRRSKPEFALDRIRSILRRLGDPQHGRTTIHIAGSKGKGSTAAMIEWILRSADFTTGLFTSPHLHSFDERIRINGYSDEWKLAYICGILRPFINAELTEQPGHVSTFEILTAAGLTVFALEEVDVQIVEVGLGGRLDCTNVFAETDVAVITSLSHEHTDILGDQITQIAAEKAGIIHDGCRAVVLAPQRYPAAADIIRQAAEAAGAPLVDVAQRYRAEPAGVEQWGQWFRVERLQPRPGEAQRTMFLLPLLGRHQIDNALTAIAVVDTLNAAETLSVPTAALHQGLAKVDWPARLEAFRPGQDNIADGMPTVVIDGAHNPDSVQSALDACRDYFDFQKLHIVFGVLGDKALLDMARIIQTRSQHVYATMSDHPRARDADQVAAAFGEAEGSDWGGSVSAHPNPQAALEAVVAQAHEDDLVLVLGSLSLAADTRDLILFRYPSTTLNPVEDPTQ